MITSALTKILGAPGAARTCRPSSPPSTPSSAASAQRAQKTFELLQADGTAFLVVAAPEPDALREAAYFVERLGEDRHAAGRAGRQPGQPGAAERTLSADEAMAAAERLRKGGDGVGLTAGLLRLHADRARMVEREALLRDRFAAAHPEVPTAVVPALAGDVHDLDGLRRVGELLAG